MKCNLSDSEWKLMNHIWAAPGSTIAELTAAVRSETAWSKNTVITMLSRLEAKGALHHEDGARAKRYFPSIPREEAALSETENFLSKVYGGKLGLLMSAMVESQSLSEQDLEELSAILEKAGGDHA